MIRINLLGGERQKKARAVPFDLVNHVTLGCTLVLVVAGALVGWWYWSLRQTSEQVDREIAAAQQEVARLQSVIREVQQFDQQRVQLQQRVTVIEQLRSGQSTPVQLLDHVSRSLPDMLWLTQVNQRNAEVTIEGRSSTLIGISDFIGNLGNGSVLQRPIELVSSQVETVQQRGSGAPAEIDVIRFTVKAQVTPVLPSAPAVSQGGGR